MVRNSEQLYRIRQWPQGASQEPLQVAMVYVTVEWLDSQAAIGGEGQAALNVIDGDRCYKAWLAMHDGKLPKNPEVRWEGGGKAGWGRRWRLGRRRTYAPHFSPAHSALAPRPHANKHPS